MTPLTFGDLTDRFPLWSDGGQAGSVRLHRSGQGLKHLLGGDRRHGKA